MTPMGIEVEWLVKREMHGQRIADEMRRAAWAEQWGLTGEPIPPSSGQSSWMSAIGRRVAEVAWSLTRLRKPAIEAPAA